MHQYGQTSQNAQYAQNAMAPKDARPMNRIEMDIEQIKNFAERLESTTERIVQHARSLGYFDQPPTPAAVAPQPVITTMADALQALGRAVDHCSGSLNLFD